MRALLILLMVLSAGPAAAQTRVPASQAEVTLSYAPVVKAVTPSVVNIYAKRVVEARVSPFANDPFFSEFFNMRTRPRVQNSLGSGVILAADGIVVSNFHVVGNATDIRVVLADRREFDAEVVLADPGTDLAILQLSGAPDLPALEFADSDRVEVGDLVLAVGNPFGVGQTVSSGIISASARSGQVGGRPGYFIQTDAPINPGNSGGALVDMNGQLVGINTAIVTRSGGSDGIGFAIPANLVRQYVSQAAAGKTELVRPWAGVTVQTVDGPLAEALGLDLPQGVLISALHPLSPFAVGGLEIGDVVTAIGGLPVDGGPEMLFRLLTLGIGAETEVGFLRDGDPLTATVELAAAPDDPPRRELRIQARSILNGLSAANVNPAVIQELRLPLGAEGVVVTGVEDIAIRTRLRPGDLLRRINGQRIANTDDLRRIAQARVAGYEIEFERGGQRGIVRLRN
ncbi:MAG: trypsin-like peptidase domain-containing protein [Rhodobacter sp.]|nr:trypsin-like peptidase domain-containing protein [Rhodobacter sp.]